MLPWKNSWFQIAFFTWIVSGALLIVDYAPKIPISGHWMQALQRAHRKPLQAPVKPPLPSEEPSPLKQRAPTEARKAPKKASERPTPANPAIGPASAEAEAEVLYSGARYSEALPLFLQACASTITQGCNYAGTMFEFGKGAIKSDKRAAVLYRKSCTAGDQTGCYNLKAMAAPPKTP